VQHHHRTFGKKNSDPRLREHEPYRDRNPDVDRRVERTCGCRPQQARDSLIVLNAL
jgi:hypothetical protein